MNIKLDCKDQFICLFVGRVYFDDFSRIVSSQTIANYNPRYNRPHSSEKERQGEYLGGLPSHVPQNLLTKS
jgi:hypothetical protein